MGSQGIIGPVGPAGPAGPRSDEWCPGFVRNNVCVLSYDNTQSTQWIQAATNCIAQGGDLCTASQYHSLRKAGNTFDDLFYAYRPVWTNAFSDNEGGVAGAPQGVAGVSVFSADNPTITTAYSYACCAQITPEPFRSKAVSHGGVKVTYLHTLEDTTWTAAAQICHARGADLCSKSQYVVLNEAGAFNSNTSNTSCITPPCIRRATSEMSGNDAGLFSSVVGFNVADDEAWNNRWAFACCAYNRPLDGSCPSPGERIPAGATGQCVVALHQEEDTDFFGAARNCVAAGADVCSKSQMQLIRNAGRFSTKSWTNDGADNDDPGTTGGAGGLLSSQPDNPHPANDKMGYACCL